MINDTPGFMQYNFSETVAKLILNHIDKSPKMFWTKSLISQEIHQNKLRTSSQMLFDFLPKNIKDKTLKELDNCKNEYNKKYAHAHLNNMEKINILKYKEGEYFDEHCDHGWCAYRTSSVIVYINPNEYQGGETYFPFFNLHVKPETASILIFPSNYVYAHRANPVTKGEKIVLVTWLSDLPNNIKYMYKEI